MELAPVRGAQGVVHDPPKRHRQWLDHRRGLAMAISSILVSFSFSMSPKWIEWLKERAMTGMDNMGLGDFYYGSSRGCSFAIPRRMTAC